MNKIDKLLEKYFYIPENINLHITPRYGYLVHRDKGFNVLNLNSAALLYHANGKNKIIDSIELIYQKPLKSLKVETIDNIISFINKSIEYGDLVLSNEPKEVKFSKTGNFDIFYPLHFAIELTYKCNLKCIHCYAEADTKNSQYINSNLLMKFLAEAKKNGLVSVEFTGGEPFLHPNFFKFLEYCLNNFKAVGILTNGTLLKKNKDILNKYLIYKDKLIFGVSIHGPNPKIHESITKVKGSFKDVVAGIKMLSELGFRVKTSMSLTPLNIDYLEETIIFTKQLGSNKFGFDNVQPTGRGKYVKTGPCDYSNEQTELLHSKELFEKYDGYIAIISKKIIQDRKKYGNCGAGHKNLAITPNGDIIPCLFLHKELKSFGNIKDNIEDIFSSPEIEYWANLKEPDEEICGDCGYLNYCKGCPMRAIFSMNKKGSICKWAKEVDFEHHLNYILD